MAEQLITPRLVKIIMAIGMLLCLLPMSYGYYQLVRFGGMVGFAYLAYNVKSTNEKLMWVYIALAILFQPLIKIALGRTLWNGVDIVLAVWLLYTVYNARNKTL